MQTRNWRMTSFWSDLMAKEEEWAIDRAWSTRGCCFCYLYIDLVVVRSAIRKDCAKEDAPGWCWRSGLHQIYYRK